MSKIGTKIKDLLKNNNKKDKSNPKNEVFEKSIVLIGPVGVGKSLISRELHDKTGMPIITLDMMRFCPMDIKEIQDTIDHEYEIIKKLENELRGPLSERDRIENKNQIDRLRGNIKSRNYEIEMRKLLPNLPNYKQMGFKYQVSEAITQKYGEIGWHFYHKQFENQLLTALAEQLTQPCIIDTGGGVPIFLGEEYKTSDKKPEFLEKEPYKSYFDLSQIDKEHITKFFDKFPNVVNLKLPPNYQQTMRKASEDKLNPLFVRSGQYDALAKGKINISIDNLYSQELDHNGHARTVINKQTLIEITQSILENGARADSVQTNNQSDSTKNYSDNATEKSHS